MKVLFTLLFLTASPFAQRQSPNAVLITEFPWQPCEFVLSSSDAFAAELARDPTSRGAIVIYRPKHQPKRAELQRKMISGYLQRAGLDRDRFNFYSGGPSPDGEPRVEYWKQPAGAIPPVQSSVIWNEPGVDTSRKFLFGSVDVDDICPIFVPRAYARLILANPSSIGQIVIYDGEERFTNRFAFAEQWINPLVERYDLPRNRIRLIFRKGVKTFAEFWYVPARKSMKGNGSTS